MVQELTEEEFRTEIGNITNEVAERARDRVNARDEDFAKAIVHETKPVLLAHEWFDPEQSRDVDFERLRELSSHNEGERVRRQLDLAEAGDEATVGSEAANLEGFVKAFEAVRYMVEEQVYEWVTVR